MRISDWRSDVCSSDLEQFVQAYIPPLRLRAGFDYYRAIDQTMRDNESRLTRKLTMPILAIGGEKAAGASVRSEEHTSELQSLMRNSYAVFCLKKKKKTKHKRKQTNTLSSKEYVYQCQ